MQSRAIRTVLDTPLIDVTQGKKKRQHNAALFETSLKDITVVSIDSFGLRIISLRVSEVKNKHFLNGFYSVVCITYFFPSLRGKEV